MCNCMSKTCSSGFLDSSLPTAEEYREDISAVARHVQTHSSFLSHPPSHLANALIPPPLPPSDPPSHPPVINGSHLWHRFPSAQATHLPVSTNHVERHKTAPDTNRLVNNVGNDVSESLYMNLDDLPQGDDVVYRPKPSHHHRFPSADVTKSNIRSDTKNTRHTRVASFDQQQPLNSSIVEVRANGVLTSSLPVGLRVLPLTTDDSAASSCKSN